MGATSQNRATRVTGMGHEHDGVYLRIEEVTDTSETTRVTHGRHQPTVSGAEMCSALTADHAVIKVRYADGKVACIVSVAEWRTSTGLGDGRWTVLVPSAMPAV
jgi:hypothetical protein